MFPASGQVQAIMDGIEDLARSSCVKFKPYKKGDRDAVVIQVFIILNIIYLINVITNNILYYT